MSDYKIIKQEKKTGNETQKMDAPRSKQSGQIIFMIHTALIPLSGQGDALVFCSKR